MGQYWPAWLRWGDNTVTILCNGPLIGGHTVLTVMSLTMLEIILLEGTVK